MQFSWKKHIHEYDTNSENYFFTKTKAGILTMLHFDTFKTQGFDFSVLNDVLTSNLAYFIFKTKKG